MPGGAPDEYSYDAFQDEACMTCHTSCCAWKAPEEFNRQQALLVSGTETAARKDAYRKALDIWTDEVPGTMLYNPLETYALKKSVNWEPYSLYYMDFRPYNLTFEVGG